MDEDVLGVDVGGTAIKTWWHGGAGPTVPTPKGDPTGERTADLLAGLAAGFPGVAAIGVATPGIVDDEAGVTRMSVNLGWQEVPVRDLLESRTGVPVALTHDVRAGAVAERLTGAGAGRPGALVFAPVGTGLALAVVDADARPIGTGWAGEVGQLRFGPGPHRGLRVEEVASAGGLALRYGAPEAAPVLAAMQAGDAVAAERWRETVDALAEVLAWTIALIAPGTVAVGGGLARAGDALLDPLRAALAERLAGFPEPVVVPAAHGTAAAAIGAAHLADVRRRSR
ncbi:ROK family protein [Amnibacterium kyonggiense]|uniref:Glucokinase n=1 Tax=Amnibacterium kyonggiense TaxID=595671 RepID=A0A4R7FL82_9MICO|nr:ROK family protein [Amnibacterium kyonggiense]TDS77136.1 glucokinase [Amnibacterium kyonggiense]